jgi:hypothetical protein
MTIPAVSRLPLIAALSGLTLGLLGLAPASAQTLIESYTARLSSNDHYNSSGERLTSPAAIIRQDRANFHKFGLRDPEDEGDRYFSSASNRALMERLLERGRTTGSARRSIVDGTPLIHIEVYDAPGGAYIKATVD